jgi:G:T-mismatch repair DNA endonuclease (very short patch repair protein)
MGFTRCSLKPALKLLRRLRSANKTMPVLYYHGCFESKHRAARAATAKKDEHPEFWDSEALGKIHRKAKARMAQRAIFNR